MSNKKKESTHEVYEFRPDETITTAEIIELSKLIRIGIGGNTLANASTDLKKYFKEAS